MLESLKRLLPESLRSFLRGRWRDLHYGGKQVYCPCCEKASRLFLPFGVQNRPGAQCPRCGSLERHRLLWLYLQEKTELFTAAPLSVLHVAPEPAIQRRLCRLPNLDYLSIDLDSPVAMVPMDITQMGFSANTFDVILCNHVLEHIVEDGTAMRELYRVLKPGGWAILQSPIDITRAQTLEDPAVVTPEERARRFGQADHVRIYGQDYRDRLTHAGFVVTADPYVRGLDPAAVRRFGLMPDEDIYLCRKP